MEQLNFDGILVEDVNIIHDSTKEVFRFPLGAVAGGMEIKFALKINNALIERAELCVLRGDTIDHIVMEPEGEAANFSPFLLARYTVPYASPGGGCVLWYWFKAWLQGNALCYYGAEPPFASGLGRIYRNPPPAFQITVYDADFTTPDWTKSAVMYQIFPDRFCMGNVAGVRAGVEYHWSAGRTEFELQENWDAPPVFEAKDGRSYYMPGDIFGGDLEGIRRRLPYLKELGVTLIYLNPIFEAASNHRYNTGDYLKIDPILGDANVFRRLISEAHEMGIRLILDGVFSHTGDDSVYFNKYGRYDGAGAYQSKDSPYYSWYRFENNNPDKYNCWWGFESLPEVNELDPGWQEFIITGRDSIVKHWLGEGASGYRLDVADELPDEVIEKIRTAVKEVDPEAFLLGEVWEEATTKQSYGRQRKYAFGRGLDAVMNYPFLHKTMDFLKEKINAWQYCKFLTHQQHTYPAPMYYTLMNLMSSHDVSRVRTMLACNVDPGSMSREEQSRFVLSEEEYSLGGLRQRLAAAIQFSLPGVPSIYYGDETGMTGLLDPFNRRAFREEDVIIREWYRKLAALRHEHPAVSTGYVRFFSTDGSVLGILRHTAEGLDFFGREIGMDAVLTVVNPTKESRRIVFELEEIYDLLATECRDTGARTAAGLLTGREAPLEKGLAEIDMPPLSAELFRFV